MLLLVYVAGIDGTQLKHLQSGVFKAWDAADFSTTADNIRVEGTGSCTGEGLFTMSIDSTSVVDSGSESSNVTCGFSIRLLILAKVSSKD